MNGPKVLQFAMSYDTERLSKMIDTWQIDYICISTSSRKNYFRDIEKEAFLKCKSYGKL